MVAKTLVATVVGGGVTAFFYFLVTETLRLHHRIMDGKGDVDNGLDMWDGESEAKDKRRGGGYGARAA